MSVPFDDGLRFDDDQDLPPILPELGKNHPEESIPPMQLRPVNFPVENGQLLTQREILCRERCSGHDEGPDEHKESGNEDHNCVANHQKEDGPDDQAEWLTLSLTASMSTRDEVFGRDSAYLFVSLNLFGRHSNEAFSSLACEDYKNFLRLKIEPDGKLTIFPIDIRRVARRWKDRPEGAIGPELVPDDPKVTAPELIEEPIYIPKEPIQALGGSA